MAAFTADMIRAIARRQVEEARADVAIARVRCIGDVRYNGRYGNWFLHQHEGHLRALEQTLSASDAELAPMLRVMGVA